MEKCQLCDRPALLQNSHIIPSFVGAWLKETSITGYLRQAVSPNIRKQDITKVKLLCKECENMLSVNENQFKRNIFHPYVTNELNEWGVARGVIQAIEYKSWLLDFIIGLQWRTLVTHEGIEPIKEEDPLIMDYYRELITFELTQWQNYLMKKQASSGNSRHYLIFLQNLIAGNGNLPSRINSKVNTYLIRSVDSTLAISNSHLFLFTKMGPVLVLSAIKPGILGGMNDAQIKRKGVISTAQRLRNKYINEFIFITRPNEAFSLSKMSEAQANKVMKNIQDKIKSETTNLQEAYLLKSNVMLRERINRQKRE